jgi:hypothetical protein
MKRKFHPLLRGAAMFVIAFVVPLFTAPNAKAFALLGPYTDWMAKSNSYHWPSDIGGPMDMNEEYRWNVPVVTYGFDKSFLEYFGSNGVAAVESAIQILNDLPPASDIVLSNYPVETRRLNVRAGAANLSDLKSVALALLVEQLGLAQPTRNVLDLRGWVPQIQSPFSVCATDTCPLLLTFPDRILRRNFDPETLAPSFAVNDIVYAAVLFTNSPTVEDLIETDIAQDPLGTPYAAVADAFSFWYSGYTPGIVYTGLTRDDVGGLRYLLSSTNVNRERWLRDVVFIHPHGTSKFRDRGAWRPGVEKITFVPQPVGRHGKFKPLVTRYSDTLIVNGTAVSQPVKRVVAKPDFLFSARNTLDDNAAGLMFSRSGTSNWVNHAALNGHSTKAGPGVIHPQVKISFYNQVGLFVSTSASFPAQFTTSGWASYDTSTNPPILYPPHSPTAGLSVYFHFVNDAAVPTPLTTNSTFHLNIPTGTLVSLQTSTNQTDWTSLATVTNTGAIIDWTYFGTDTQMTFRVVPQ